MTRNALLALAAGAVLLFAPATADAFCRTRTCDPSDASQQCELDQEDCVITGRTLYWASECVTFNVQRDGSARQGFDVDTIESVVERSFATWLRSGCEGGAPKIQIGYLGPVDCGESRYNEHGRNANIVVFRDDAWPYEEAIDTYGLTRVRFDRNTGAIFDADIEINSFRFDIALDDSQDGVNLESILTHEVGHFLGLSHAAPADDSATMRAGWNGKGNELATLSADDTDGICAIYPPARTPVSKSCEPRHGFGSECNEPLDPPDDAGCSLGTAPRPRAPWVPASLLVGLVLVRRRREPLSRARPC